MGDLKGHALPGTFFLLYGFWWAFCCLKRFMTCRKAGSKYIATATYTCPCACGRLGSLPVEGAVKVALSAVGMIGEITFNLPHPSHGIIQHATMYFFFLMSGVVDIILHYGVPLPPASDYVSLVVALTVECLLFANHLHGRGELDVHIHVLLVYVLMLTVVVVILEARYQRSAILALSRSFLLLLQGSWFWAVGIILYGHGEPNTTWDVDNPGHVMLATIYFSWHCAFHFILLFVMSLLMYCCYRMRDGPSTFNNGSSALGSLQLTQLEGGKSGDEYRRLTFHDDPDEDSDIEFEKPVDKSGTALSEGSNV